MIENLENEEWRDVVGYDGDYKISSLGRVRSLKKITYRCDTNQRKDKLLSCKENSQGYVKVNLCRNGIEKLIAVHRLVAIAFLKKLKGKDFVNHKNGIKNDNRPENLEWCTASQNCKHALLTGLRIPNKGEEMGHTRLTNEEVFEIKKLHANGISPIDISRNYSFNCSHYSIIKITAGLSWKHIKI